MKRLLCMIVVVLLLAGAACAEGVQTRERTILVEGTEEVIVETLYESPLGFRLWYPADWFEAKHEDGNDYFLSATGDLEVGFVVTAGRLSPGESREALQELIEASLVNGGEVPGGIEEWQLESGLTVEYLEMVFGEDCNLAYNLHGDGRVFCISCNYPMEAAEGFGARIRQAISTFELLK